MASASASAASAASAKSNNTRNNKSDTNKIKIISFNVASPEFMCFNMRIPPPCYENRETQENINERAELIVKHLNLQNDVDFMCFQEMFPELNVSRIKC
jgi:mRNA deadenylase 3'-5' endonuclease subunit Ccr4